MKPRQNRVQRLCNRDKPEKTHTPRDPSHCAACAAPAPNPSPTRPQLQSAAASLDIILRTQRRHNQLWPTELQCFYRATVCRRRRTETRIACFFIVSVSVRSRFRSPAHPTEFSPKTREAVSMLEWGESCTHVAASRVGRRQGARASPSACRSRSHTWHKRALVS